MHKVHYQIVCYVWRDYYVSCDINPIIILLTKGIIGMSPGYYGGHIGNRCDSKSCAKVVYILKRSFTIHQLHKIIFIIRMKIELFIQEIKNDIIIQNVRMNMLTV